MADHPMLLIFVLVVVLNVQVHGHNTVGITILESAVSKGAVCLDGSPPAYHYAPGHGEGSNNWLVSLSGGGWCSKAKECWDRSQAEGDPIVGSKLMPTEFNFIGILSPSEKLNPYFYNWNRIFVRYCDGASFAADVEEVEPKYNLTFRGARIFKTVVEDLLEKGMKNATNAILTGQSAGGLATMLKCDDFRAMLPNTPRVKCIAESGLFFQGKGLPWNRYPNFVNTIRLHGLAQVLPKSCTSKMDPELCLFPENFMGDIQTPLFIIQSQFDSMQLIWFMDKIDKNLTDDWRGCTNVTIPFGTCKPELRKIVLEYQKDFQEALPKCDGSISRGYYIDSCSTHDHNDAYLWNGRRKLKKTVAEAVGDWYFDHSGFKEIEKVNHPINCTAT